MNHSGYQNTQDAELEGLAAGGDKEAFAELYNRHFDRVYDFSLRLLRDADEAADVAQETFLKAMAALSPKEKRAAFTTWVLTIARNTALNRLRSRRKVAEPSLDEAEQPEAIYREVDADRLGSPEKALEAKELAGLVWQAATALDPKQYSLLDLHLRQGLDSGEIAEVLGTSKNNAYVMMTRLRDSVEESITAFIMARRGRRECAALNDLLTSRGAVFFDADMRKAVARHIDACPTCQEQRKKLVSPSAIFGALAAVPVPFGLKQRALAEAMGKWATLAGSEAGKAGGFLFRLLQPLRSVLSGLGQAGWFAGWKGAALLVGGLLVAGGIGGGAVVLSGFIDGGEGERASAQDQAERTATPAVGALSTREPTPISTPTPQPSPTATPPPASPTPPPQRRVFATGAGIMFGSERLTDEPCDESPAVTRDGKTVVFVRGDPDPAHSDLCESGPIMTIGTDGSGLRQVAPMGSGPSWHPDGSSIVFWIANSEAYCDLSLVFLNVNTGEQRVLPGFWVAEGEGWSGDGAYLLVERCQNGYAAGTVVITPDGQIVRTFAFEGMHPWISGWTPEGDIVLIDKGDPGSGCLLASPVGGEIRIAPQPDPVQLDQTFFPWEITQEDTGIACRG